ncbi:hypothetical protein SDC9_100886 [bioreactor metagenome]|uniref:Uncharacterized protein n=1 Tax=bioreactor metagenome TaxID=1076179 RepID=A0A645ATB5_9ZZZZ
MGRFTSVTFEFTVAASTSEASLGLMELAISNGVIPF